MSWSPFRLQAASYAQFRPSYPKALLNRVLDATSDRKFAVDIGCGSGQFLIGIAPHFNSLLGTDRTQEQLDKAPSLPNVSYVLESSPDATAALTGLAAGECDLVSAAQMIHWITDPNDLNNLMATIARVLRPRTGVAAFVGYAICRPRDEIVASDFTSFYANTENLWDPQCDRKLLDRGLVGLDLHGHLTLKSHEWFTDRHRLTVKAFLNYLATWSAFSGRLSLLDGFAAQLHARAEEAFEMNEQGEYLLDVDFDFFCLLATRP